MVAKVDSSYSIHRTFNYNENKVKSGKAVCIGAGNYPLDHTDMTVSMRLNGLLKRIERNQRAKRNSVHISLNFDPSEKDLSEQKLMQIAASYMQKIGFADQPYLVYQHFDAAHPHIHIVSTTIKEDKNAIDMHLIGQRKSEPARKEIEKEFGLVQAQKQHLQTEYRLKPIDPAVIIYGQLPTKQAIQNVLKHVWDTYRYTSLHEYNAVLGLYNIKAHQGEENSRIRRHRGLIYQVLDKQGNPIGVPIKASDFYMRPTLTKIEEKFSDNEKQRARHKTKLKNTIDIILNRKGISIDEFLKELSVKGIDAVLRKNEQGFIYGVTYVDHVTACVFNGSNLGKNFSAKMIRERCNVPLIDTDTHSGLKPQGTTQKNNRLEVTNDPPLSNDTFQLLIAEVFNELFKDEYLPEYIPYELSLKRRRKKRKRKSITET